MTAHELAKELLAGPDLRVVIPTYSAEADYWSNVYVVAVKRDLEELVIELATD